MSIEYPEKGTFGPIIALLTRWFHYIQYDRYPIFIIVSYYPLISISRIPSYDPIFPDRAFCLFKVGQLYCVGVGIRCISKEQSIDISDYILMRNRCLLRLGCHIVWGMCGCGRAVTHQAIWVTCPRFNLVREGTDLILRATNLFSTISRSIKPCPDRGLWSGWGWWRHQGANVFVGIEQEIIWLAHHGTRATSSLIIL